MSRFYNYPEAEELQNDDVFLIDGETDGTRKIPANKMADFFGEQVPTDKTLSIENKAADAKKTGDEISDLKSAISTLGNTYIALNGENQVAPQNIDGVEFTKKSGTAPGDNIFDPTTNLFSTGRYIITDNGEIGTGSNANINAYVIPVDGVSVYTFTEARFAALGDGNTIGSNAIGEYQENISQINTTGASYLFLSYNINNVDISNVEVKRIETATIYEINNTPWWMKPEYITPFKKITGNLSAGGRLYDSANRREFRKNDRVVFRGDFESFTSLIIGSRYSQSANYNYFLIDSTNVSYYQKSSSTPVSVAHGLTFNNNIQVLLEQTEMNQPKITIFTNGNMFQTVFSNLYCTTTGAPMAEAGGAMTNCELSWICTDIHLPIWIFGDSYLGASSDRWPYYLHEFGYDRNALLSGWAGESSVNTCVAFENYLNYGRPRYACYFTGMNDESDSSSAPSTYWATYRDRFISDCENAHVIPVFCTIPTVSTVNNEQKNTWVRSSGYRYIDFAKAVGAQADGTWFSGMLSQDGVHPTEKGAKALFAQFMADFPEIMLGATWGNTLPD